MNAFATTFHLLRTDLRRFRHLILGLAVLAGATVIAERAALPRGVGEGLFGIFRVGEILAIVLLAAQAVLADSAAHTRSQWWARPIGIGTLFASKAAYVLVAIWLPLLVIHLFGWLHDDFTFRQILLGTGETSLYVFALGALSAGVAAGSTSIWGYAARLGCGFIALMACLFGLSFLRAGYEVKTGWTVSGGTFVTLVFAVFLVAGLLALAGVYLSRQRAHVRGGWVLAVTFPIWMPSINNEAPRPGESHPGIALAAPERSDSGQTDLLFENLSVRGVPDRHFPFPLEAKFAFTDASGTEARYEYTRRRRANPSSDSFVVLSEPYIRKTLGHDIRILNDRRSYRHRFDSRVNVPGNLDRGQPGRLEGELRYLLCETVHVGMLDMKQGAEATHHGHRLQIVRIDTRDGDLRIDLRLSRPRLLWSDRIGERDARHHHHSGSEWMLVMVLPDSRDTYIVPVKARGVGGPFPVTVPISSNTRIDHAGIRVDDRKLPELHAFLVHAKEAYAHAFAWSGHTLDHDPNPGGWTARWPGDPKRLDAESIAALSSLEDLENDDLDHEIDFKLRDKLRERAAELFAADIPGALERVPWRYSLHRDLEKTLGAHLRATHLAAFRDALDRDPRLINVVESLAWQDRFRDYVTREVARRHPRTEIAALRLAASYGDPELADDLSWHFLHNTSNRYRIGEIYAPLSRLEGVDARALLEHAWERSRFDHQRSLWPLALEHGLAGAMEHAIGLVLGEGISENPRHSGVIVHLRKLTDFDGTHAEFYPWFVRNGHLLSYNAETRTYGLP